MRKLLIFLAAHAVIAGYAQQKELSSAQMLKGDKKGLLNDMPKVLSWADETHYVLAKPKQQPGKFDTVSVDVKTGAETPFKLAAATSLKVTKGDIYLSSASGEKRLTETGEEEKNPTLSPDGNKVAFTRANNLYVLDISTGKETQLTQDGSDVIYNGYASWVYFEEILGRASKYKAFWWSPDSKRIAYMRFDDTRVPVFPIYSSEGQHGFLENTRYPKVGDANPEVKIGVVNIDNANTVWAAFNERDDQYFGTPFWTPDGKWLWVQWMNRGQDKLIVFAVDPASGRKQPLYEENQNTWVEWLENIQFLGNNKGFVIMSDKSGWNHIYHHANDGKLIKQVTDGAWTVKDILHIDEKTNTIYYTARKENSARYDLYSSALDGKNQKRLTFGDYTHTVNLSPAGSYFITNYSNVTTPNKLALVTTKTLARKEIFDSKGAELDNYKLAKTELVRVKVANYELPVLITWPINMDSSKKYPVLVSIYGGPNAGTVYDGWKGIGQNQWWAKEGIVQVAIDHRGSGHFGKAGQNQLFRDLGNHELQDYIDVVKWLTSKPYIDKQKVAITGFSYGGYVTCLALTKGSDVFSYGIAGGSVTDWSLYDTHYTERFMDTPKENEEGYKKSSVFNYIDKYKGGLYIVHGTMDDNVHMQNSIQLVSALQDKKKDFMFMLYPGGRHGWANLPAKNAHFNNEKAKFYYQYLLNKPLAREVLQ